MKKILFIILLLGLIISCTVQKPLYSYGKYEALSYNYLKNSDEKSTQDLMDSYKNILENQTGTRNVPPPGLYADYAFVLFQVGKTEEGKAMLLKEVELYPESKILIDRILNMLER